MKFKIIAPGGDWYGIRLTVGEIVDIPERLVYKAEQMTTVFEPVDAPRRGRPAKVRDADEE